MQQSDTMQLVLLAFLLIAISYNVFSSRFYRTQPIFQYVAIWAAIIVIMLIGYSFKEQIIDVVQPSKVKEVDGTLIVRKSDGGHYFIDTAVNGKNIRFMVDTGATDVMLSPIDAAKIGVDFRSLVYDRQYKTANGVVSSAQINLESVKIGSLEFRNIEASIPAAQMDVSLLGMSFLERFEYYKFEKDQLIMKY